VPRQLLRQPVPWDGSPEGLASPQPRWCPVLRGTSLHSRGSKKPVTRTEWNHLPDGAREAVELKTGQIADVRNVPNGVMSAFASLLQTRSGLVFVKGTPRDNPAAWVYKHESKVTRRAPLAPPALWEAEGGGWLMYGYAYLSGRHPSFAPGSPDLRALVAALTVVSGHPWPTDISKKSLADRLAVYLPPEGTEALEGSTLVHSDMGEFNLLITQSGMRLLDWGLSCPGPAWADAALIIPRLILAGHSPAQARALAELVPAYREADPAQLALFARSIHAFWAERTRQDPLPHRMELTAAAQQWALMYKAQRP
jgi:hypothetical protein